MASRPKSAFTVSAAAEVLPRWDMSKIYPAYNSPEFEADFKKMSDSIAAFAADYEGKVATLDGEALADAMDRQDDIGALAGRLGTYVGLLKVQDNKAHGANAAAYSNRSRPLFSALAFFDDEIKKIPEDELEARMAASPRLKAYEPSLENTRRGIPHTPPLDVQRYSGQLAATSDWTKAFEDRLVELRFPMRGKKGGYTEEEILKVMAEDKNPERRKQATQSFQKVMKENAWFFANVHNAIMRMGSVSRKWSNFDQPWDGRHFSNNIKPEAVEALKSSVKAAYPRISHRFYGLKAQLMGQDHLNIYDRNINVFEGEDSAKIPWSEAKKIVLDSFNAFSPEMGAIAQKFFDEGWIDAAPGPNKQGGAFSSSGMAQTDHPHVMMNYRGSMRDVATLAHELGHGVHQYLAAPKGDRQVYTPLTFAETASVFAEMMTFKALLKRAPDDEARRKMLFEKTNDMINTVVRQISFYDFECRNNTMFKEKGAPLTPEEFGQNWLDALGESYGEAIPLEPEYGPVFGYIPHLVKTPFYVYAYAFGDCLVNTLYQTYEEGNVSDFKEKYTAMLEAGGTYNADKLKADFGLDINDPQFWDRGIKVIENLLDELEVMCAPLLTPVMDVNGPAPDVPLA